MSLTAALALLCGSERAFGVGAGLAEDALLVQRLLADGALAGIGREALACAQRLVAAAGARALLAAGCAARPVLPLRGATGRAESARVGKRGACSHAELKLRSERTARAQRGVPGRGRPPWPASSRLRARATRQAERQFGCAQWKRHAARAAANADAHLLQTMATPAPRTRLGAARARLNGTTRVVVRRTHRLCVGPVPTSSDQRPSRRRGAATRRGAAGHASRLARACAAQHRLFLRRWPRGRAACSAPASRAGACACASLRR